MHPSCFERWSDQLMRSPISKLPISYRRPTSHVFPDPRLSLPVWFCRLYPITCWREESRRDHRSLLWQAFTAYGLSVHHVYPPVLVSVSPTPGPEANVCLDLLRHSQRSSLAYLIFLFGSSSQIGKVRQASIHPNTVSVSTTCADPRLSISTSSSARTQCCCTIIS